MLVLQSERLLNHRAGERLEEERTRPLSRQPKGPLRKVHGFPTARGAAIFRWERLAVRLGLAVFALAGLCPASWGGERIFEWKFVKLAERERSSAVFFTSTLSGLAALDDGSMFFTHDGGGTWIRTGGRGQGKRRIAARGDLVVAAGTRSVAVSVDGGETFGVHEVPTRGEVSDVAVDASGSIWLCTTGGPILASSDKGKEWKAMSPVWPGPLFAIAITGGGRVLAGGVSGLWVREEGSAGFKRAPESAFCRFIFIARDCQGGAWPLAVCGEVARLYQDAGAGMKLRVVHDEVSAVFKGAQIGEHGMWMWTGGRMLIHSEDGKSWKRVPLPESLDGVAGAAQSTKGTVWLAGGKGGLFRGKVADGSDGRAQDPVP